MENDGASKEELRGLVQVQELDKEDCGEMTFREAFGVREMKTNLSEHFQILSKHPFLSSQCTLHIPLPGTHHSVWKHGFF